MSSSLFAGLREPLDLSFDGFIKTSSDPRRHQPGVDKLWGSVRRAWRLLEEGVLGLVLRSGKHRVCGMNVQVITGLNGRVIDTGTPIGGSRHDSVAFTESGIAHRWATHLAEGGPGMLADKGYQGCGPTTPYRKPCGAPNV